MKTILLLSMLLYSFKTETSVTVQANEYMNYLNTNKIKGGCFYMQGDSITTFKNY